MNCRPSCAEECPPLPVGMGTRCRDYREELQKAQAEREGNGARETSYRLQKLGVAADAILGLRELRPTAALAAAKRFLIADRALARVLLLGGPRGIGKTVAAAYVLFDAVRRYDWNSQPSGGRHKPPFVWAAAAEVTSVTDFGRVDPSWIEHLKACHVLVLDDLGKEGTVPGLSALRDVMVHRMENRRPSVITTNEGPREMTARYGESWLSRMSACVLMPDLSAEKTLRHKARP